MSFFKAKRKINFKTYLILTSVILTVCFLVALSFLLLFNTSLQINTKVDTINEAKTDLLSEKINSSLSDLKNRTKYLMTNQQIIQYIKDIEHSSNTSYEKNQASIDLSHYLTSLSESSPTIERIHILTDKSQYESMADTVFSYPLIFRQAEPVPKPLFSGSLSSQSAAQEGKVLEQKLFFTGSLHEGDRLFGKIYVILSDAYLRDLIDTPDGYAIIGSDDSFVINASTVGDEVIEKAYGHLLSANAFTYSNFRFYMRDIEFENWKIIYAADTTQFYSNRKTLTQNIFISMGISLVLAMAFSSFISKRILNPVKKLIGLIQKYKTKNSGDTRFVAEKKSGGSLQPRLFLFYILTIFIPILLFMGSFLINSRNTVNSYIEESYSEIFSRSSREINEYLNNKRSLLINIANDPYVQKLCSPGQFDEVSPYVLDNLWHQAFMGTEKDWIGIYSKEGKLLVSSGFTYADETNVSEFLDGTERIPDGIYMTVSSDQLGNDVLSLGAAVKNTSDFLGNKYNIGYIKIDVRFDFMKSQLENIMNGTEAFLLVDKTDDILHPGEIEDGYVNMIEGLGGTYSPQTAEIGNDKKLVFSDYLDSLEITLLSVMDYDSLFGENGFLIDNYILIMAIVLLLIFISSYFVSRRVLIPINKLNILFKETSLDTMHENALDEHAINEINELGETYNSMIARIENLIDEVILANESKNRMERGKKEAEIISLQAQINPHFLYNTLTTINGMIKSGYKEEAIEMVNALSDLFRYGISRGEIIIGIQEEIEHAKAYTNIMSLRYRDRLVFQWDIDEAAYRYSTIKLIIQPFIENSINHGVKASDKVCTVNIKCELLEKSVRFTIKDNGTGIEKEQLRLIKDNLQHGSLTGQIGIYNVQSRLLLHYGKDYGMNVESIYGKGTTVTVLIPKNELAD